MCNSLCVTHFVLNWQSTTSLIIITRYTHVHHVPHAEDMENCQNGEDNSASVPLLCSLPIALLCLSRSRVREQSESLRYCCASCLLSLLYCPWHHPNLFMQAHLSCVVSLLRCCAVLCLSCLQAVSELKRTKRGTCWRVCKLYRELVYFSRKPVTYIHTYIHTYVHTSTTSD